MILCPHCKTPLETDDMLLCPHCGTMLSSATADVPAPVPGNTPRRKLWRTLLFVFLAFIVLIGALSASAYAGLYYGERDRETQRLNRVEQHYTAGTHALNAGHYERAAAEFEYVLQLDAGHALAGQGVAEARARLAVKPTPTLEVVQSLTEQLLAQANTSYTAEDWVATARTLTQLRALDPGYAQAEVEAMLFTSLYNAGVNSLAEDSLEQGIFHLDQAIALRPLDAEAVNQRNMAARYLDALNYWAVDWDVCIERFEALTAIDPYYKDVASRLYQAHVAYANHSFEQGEMCPAEVQYAKALRLYADPQIEAKHASAAQTCLAATPAPLEGDTPHLTPQAVVGFATGRLAYPVYNTSTSSYDLYALYADGRIIRAASNADQPWWEAGTGRVVYRDRALGGVSMVLPEEGVPLQLHPPAGQAWPALSVDSQRIAYAAPDANGIWTVYVASTNNPGDARALGQGWGVAWSGLGQLAYTGCDAEGVCGVTIDNPDDDQPGTRLTNYAGDSAVSWSPAGNLLAYMTNVTGNWDILLLNSSGGVEQITADASDEGLPTWSPDGSHLAFVSNRDGNWGIYVMQMNGQDVRRILDLGAEFPGWDNQRLSWAP